ncbi:hypothetical protein FCV25MIE_08722, partial [Fagus crenata]
PWSILNEAKAGQSGKVQRATWPRSPPSRRHREGQRWKLRLPGFGRQSEGRGFGIGSDVRAMALFPDLVVCYF